MIEHIAGANLSHLQVHYLHKNKCIGIDVDRCNLSQIQVHYVAISQDKHILKESDNLAL